jgi:hypothetical protein
VRKDTFSNNFGFRFSKQASEWFSMLFIIITGFKNFVFPIDHPFISAAAAYRRRRLLLISPPAAAPRSSVKKQGFSGN